MYILNKKIYQLLSPNNSVSFCLYYCYLCMFSCQLEMSVHFRCSIHCEREVLEETHDDKTQYIFVLQIW